MKKIIIIVISIALFITLIPYMLLCTTINKRLTIEGNNNVEFISVTKDCGALSGYDTKIYLVKKGSEVKFTDEPIIELNDNNATLIWINTNRLLIKTRSNKIYNFTSFNYIGNDRYTIMLENNY